jgi:hypothetical protein
MIAEMVEAGLLTVGTDAQGRETWALTPKGARVATQMAMGTLQRPSRGSGAQLTAMSPSTRTPWRPNCLLSSAA